MDAVSKIRKRCAQIADKLSEVRNWCEIPEETTGGIDGILDMLNEISDSIDFSSAMRALSRGRCAFSRATNTYYIADEDGYLHERHKDEDRWNDLSAFTKQEIDGEWVITKRPDQR